MNAVQKSSLFVIVPGFGSPHIHEKFRILRNNIAKVLQSNAFSKIFIRVCCYDPNCMSVLELDENAPLRNLPNMQWIVQKGIVAQYIHKFATPEDVKDYDYVLIILDDVELTDTVDMAQMIQYQEQLRFDIVSPCMTLHSKYQYRYMLHDPKQQYQLKVVAACEAFCYFMPKAAYLRYHSIIEPMDNPWLWGVDLVLYKYHRFHIAIVNNMHMHHHYKNECYAMRPDTLPTEGYNSVLRKYNAQSHEFENMTAVLFFVFATSG